MAEEQKAGKIFLFCKESSQERIMKCLRDAFDVPGSAHDTGLELHNGNLNVTLRLYCESAGGEEQELVRSWSDRARGHFSRVETAVVDVKTNLLYQLEGTEGSWKWKHCGILKNRKKLEMAGLTREKGEIEDGLSRVSSEPEGGL